MTVKNIYFFSKVTIVGAAAMALSVACTGNFEDYNTNKHEVTEEMMTHDDLKMSSFIAQMQRNVVLFRFGDVTLDSDYQIAQGLSSDLYSGYVGATIAEGSGSHNGSYNFIDNWIQKIFNSGYTNIMQPWAEIAKLADEQNRSEAAALATIIKVEGMHRVADTYGPIPYVNYGTGSLQNDYDSLEDVYNKFFEELDESIDVLTTLVQLQPGVKMFEFFDIVYEGDVTSWVRFANSLRLRLAMRVANVAPGLAQEQAEKAVNNPVGLINNEAQRAAVRHSAINYYHPVYEIAYNMNKGDARIGASIESFMNGYNDPRRRAYFTQTAAGEYRGVRSGITGVSNWEAYREGTSNFNMDTGTTEIVWMTAAETYFLLAEGAVRGWAMGGSAQSFYEEGVKVSFAENGLSESLAEDYVKDNTSTPARFTDVIGNSSIDAQTSVTIKWDDSAADEVKYEKISTQKWIAMFPDGPEGWAEFRRTGYPKLLPVVRNQSGGTIDNTLQICRLPYPRTEYDTNADGVATGVAKLGGDDNGGTQLWWDRRNR